MTESVLPGGTFKLTDDITVNRMGYGAMQLAGPGVFGPPKDYDAAIAVLNEAIKMGINHIDTSDFMVRMLRIKSSKKHSHHTPMV